MYFFILKLVGLKVVEVEELLDEVTPVELANGVLTVELDDAAAVELAGGAAVELAGGATVELADGGIDSSLGDELGVSLMTKF